MLDWNKKNQNLDRPQMSRAQWEERKNLAKLAEEEVGRLELVINWTQLQSMRALKNELHSLSKFYAFLLETQNSISSSDLGYFCVLPAELIMQILSHLDAKGLCRMAQVCKEFKVVVNDETIWQQLYFDYYQNVGPFSALLNSPSSNETPQPHQSPPPQPIPDTPIANDQMSLLHHIKPPNKTWKWLCQVKLRVFKPDEVKNGPGTFVYPPTDIRQQTSTYAGDWKDDKRDGYGTFFWNKSSLYAGEWKNDLREGHGERIWPNGNKYIGEYKTHRRHGEGEFTFSNGSVFKGRFEDNKFVLGTYTWPNGRIYKGEWANVHRHGQGEYWWPDGRKYEGEWKNDKRHGRGTYSWPEGHKFEGVFSEGKRSGKGFLMCPNGDIYEQEWTEDKFDEFNKGLEPSNDVKILDKKHTQPSELRKRKRSDSSATQSGKDVVVNGDPKETPKCTKQPRYDPPNS